MENDPVDKYYQSDDIRYCLVDDVIILIDIQNGEYVHFTRTATIMWQTLLSADRRSERYAMIEGQFHASKTRLAQDLDQFTQTLLEKGYIVRGPPNLLNREAVPCRFRILLPILALWLLITTKSSLRRNGFSQVYRKCRALKKPKFDKSISDKRVNRFVQAFALAENFFIMSDAPEDCLPRSLALYQFLLGCGVSAEHWIGVKTLPFRAHAWVEFNGRAVRDSQRFIDEYTQLAKL